MTSIPPEWMPVVNALILIATLVVVGALVKWLRVVEPTIKSPLAKAAADQVIETLHVLQQKYGADVDPALDAAFHNHVVAVGAPHADDPRAP